MWFYAFRVPFLSTGPVQTHRSSAEASKEDAEFHTDLCWVCKNFSDLSKLLCWETKTKITNPSGVYRVLWFSSKTLAKAVVGHVTYKSKGFIMKPKRNPQPSDLKYTPKRLTSPPPHPFPPPIFLVLAWKQRLRKHVQSKPNVVRTHYILNPKPYFIPLGWHCLLTLSEAIELSRKVQESWRPSLVCIMIRTVQ